MAAPGWYRDPGSDRLARWFDGQEWTHHTVVMADWRGKGSPPPPEDRTIVQGASGAYSAVDGVGWAAPTGYEDFSGYDTFGSYEDEGEPGDDYVAGGGHYRQPSVADRYREGPLWFRFGAPALLLLIVVLAVVLIAGGGDDGDGGSVDLGDEGEVSLDEAIDIAYEAGFPAEVSEARLGSLISLACAQVGDDDGPEVVAEQVQRFGFDGNDLSDAVDGLEAGGEAFCGDEVEAEDPDFFRSVALLVGGSVPSSTSSTSTTVEGATSTTADVTTTTKATTTTKKPTPTTTKPSTTTTAPTTTSSTSSTTTTTTVATDGGTTDGGATDGGETTGG